MSANEGEQASANERAEQEAANESADDGESSEDMNGLEEGETDEGLEDSQSESGSDVQDGEYDDDDDDDDDDGVIDFRGVIRLHLETSTFRNQAHNMAIKTRFKPLSEVQRPALTTALAYELAVTTAATRDQWGVPFTTQPAPLVRDIWATKKTKRPRVPSSNGTSPATASCGGASDSHRASSLQRLASSTQNAVRAGFKIVGFNRGSPTTAADNPAEDCESPLSEGHDHRVPSHPNLIHLLSSREAGTTGNTGNSCWSAHQQQHISAIHFPPIVPQRTVDRRPAKCYIGQYSKDGSVFVAGYQDERIILYDVENDYAIRKNVEARGVRWTITDTCMSPDGKFLLYSTISPYVNLVNVVGTRDVVRSVANVTEIHEQLDFAGPQGSQRWGIWSMDWSYDSKDIVAGTSDPSVVIFDIETERPKCSGSLHQDDVNAVAFVDRASNVVVSGSDDTTLLVTDRRTMSRGSRPEGVFSGHTEGITHIDARGDDIHFISNAKDSTIKMWDMRMMGPASLLKEMPRSGLLDFDYRFHAYPGRNFHVQRKIDHSIMTFWGHSVLRTLIRAYWSPPSTGNRYIYSGSADGCVYIFDCITGEVKHRLDGHEMTVRDCSWHPTNNSLVSVSWDGSIMEWGPRDFDQLNNLELP